MITKEGRQKGSKITKGVQGKIITKVRQHVDAGRVAHKTRDKCFKNPTRNETWRAMTASAAGEHELTPLCWCVFVCRLAVESHV